MVTPPDSGQFVQTFFHLYERLSSKPFPKVLGDFPQTMFGGPTGILPGLTPYLYLLYETANLPWPQIKTTLDARVEESYLIPANNKCLVAFSAGKDSVVSALLAQQAGRDVTLFHVAGINRSYGNERQYAQRLAKAMNLPMVVREIDARGKCDYAENPTKNHLIQAFMVEHGIATGCTEFCWGAHPYFTLENSNLRFNNSDTAEYFALLKEFYRAYIPSYRDYFPVQNETDAFIKLNKLRPDMLKVDMVCSCSMPVYRKPHLRAVNMKKYGVELETGRCGSCQKCATEYIHKAILGVVPLNAGFFQHSVDVCRSHRYEDCAVDKDFSGAPENEIMEYFVHFDDLPTIPGWEAFDPKKQTLLQYMQGR
jgi:hypothetical protein